MNTTEHVSALGARLQSLRRRRGWIMDHVAAIAGVSRTTLCHLESGKIARPRVSTLQKLARVLEVPVESLVDCESRIADCGLNARESPIDDGGSKCAGLDVRSQRSEVSNPEATFNPGRALCGPDRKPFNPQSEIRNPKSKIENRKSAAAFDRSTNPFVTQIAAERPGLFDGWSPDDWDELYSQFGVGGPLTEEGVLAATSRINLNRDAVYRLRIVMQTHLADVAAALVETLYRQVCVGSPGEPKSE